MSRFVPQGDMGVRRGDVVLRQAIAILYLSDSSAWAIHNGSGATVLLANSTGSAMRLGVDVLETVHEALETHGQRVMSNHHCNYRSPPENGVAGAYNGSRSGFQSSSSRSADPHMLIVIVHRHVSRGQVVNYCRLCG